MVLREPTQLAGAELSDAVTRRLRNIAEDYNRQVLGESRLCVLFEDRAEAAAWIERRHGRGQEGEGRIPWGPLEIQRFQGDRTVLDLLDFVARNGGYNEDEWANIRAKLSKRSSVLRRFLDSKAGMDALGLDEEKDGTEVRPITTRDPAYLVALLKKLFNDIASNAVNSRSYNKASEIQAYFDALPGELNPKTASSRKDAKPFHGLTTTPVVPPSDLKKDVPKKVQASVPKLRPTLSPKQLDFAMPVNEKGVQFIREAARIQLKEMPLSAAFLLRGFIQFVIDAYITDTDGLEFWENDRQLDLNVRGVRVLDHLIQVRKAKRHDLSGIRRMLTEKASNNPSSIQALNDYHHDRYQVPDADALRSGWDHATALFVAVLGKAK